MQRVRLQLLVLTCKHRYDFCLADLCGNNCRYLRFAPKWIWRRADISSEGKAAATEVVSGVRNTRMRSGHLPPQRNWDFVEGYSSPETPTRAPVLNAAGMRTRRSAAMEESLRPSASSLSAAVSGTDAMGALGRFCDAQSCVVTDLKKVYFDGLPGKNNAHSLFHPVSCILTVCGRPSACFSDLYIS